METIKINELIERCLHFFQDTGYSNNSIRKYKTQWRNGILKYMQEIGTEMYTIELGAAFKESCISKGNVCSQQQERLRSIQVLDDMLQLGTIRLKCTNPIVYTLSGEIGKAMEKLITHLVELRRSKVTINGYRRYLSEFLTHLNGRGIVKIEQISESTILAFITVYPANKANMVAALRMLFRFWEEQKILTGYFTELLDSYKTPHVVPIPSYYNHKDVQKIIKSIPRSSSVGKRDYAMTNLATHLGMRAGDIANLKLEDIDWEANIIRIVMQKTKKLIELPLLPDVGNAIIDYLKNGRPTTTSHNVFLTARPPFKNATSLMVSSAIGRIIQKSGVNTSGKKKGPHALRHSLATCMMEEGSPMPSISEALGHRRTDTTMDYIKIDINSLKKCALDVPEVPESFYKQKGGAFYG